MLKGCIGCGESFTAESNDERFCAVCLEKSVAEAGEAYATKIPAISGDVFSIIPEDGPLLPGYSIEWSYPPVPEAANIQHLSDYDMENLLATLLTWKQAKNAAQKGEGKGETLFIASYGELNITFGEDSFTYVKD